MAIAGLWQQQVRRAACVCRGWGIAGPVAIAGLWQQQVRQVAWGCRGWGIAGPVAIAGLWQQQRSCLTRDHRAMLACLVDIVISPCLLTF